MLPELIYGCFDKRLNFTGYLVIDSTVENKSCGGVRLSSTVTLNEVRDLARNMTLKYSFLGIHMGGAKAGIQIAGTLSKNMKGVILAEFGKRLGRLIKKQVFIPGTDIGTSEEDIVHLLNAASGKKNYVDIKPSIGPELTSWTMLSSARQALNFLRLSTQNQACSRQIPSELDKTAVAIEGFGKVGSAAARAFSESGAKIVAISTIHGAIHNPKGLDSDRLLDLRNEYGDDLVNSYHGAQKIESDRLVELPIDILLPCAGSYTINSAKAHKIKARVVCPGANIPLTDQAEEILSKRGIVSVPDFVSNSGAVLGNFMTSYVGKEAARALIDEEFGQKVYKLLTISKEQNTHPRKVAIELAVRGFHDIKKSEGKFSRLFLRAIRRVLPEAYQRIGTKTLATYAFSRQLKQTS